MKNVYRIIALVFMGLVVMASASAIVNLNNLHD
jgi:hypothetical protein